MSWFYRLLQQCGKLPFLQRLRPLGDRWLQWSVGAAGLAWSLNGIACRIDPRFRRELAPNYDASLAQYLAPRVRAGQVCLDVGANLGAWVIQFAHWVGPTGRVLAFEPNPATQAVLAEHIRMNQLSNCTTIVPAAVGARAGTATFFASDVDGMSRIGSPNPHLQKTSQMLEVPVLTLDAYCAEQHLTPDWLFIDIEGYEAHALMGAEALIRHCGANLGIIVEMHPSLWSASNTTPNDFRALLARLERKAIPLTGQTDVFVDYGHVVLEPLTSETKIL